MLVGSCGEQITSRTSSDVFIFNLGLRFEGLFWEVYFEAMIGANRQLVTNDPVEFEK